MNTVLAHATTALTLLAALACAPHAQAAEDALTPADAVVVKDFDVYVDLPTNFVFVKLPQGWKFVGSVDSQSMARLPDSVHTWLLPADADDTVRLARNRSASTAKAPRS